jgi:hypothetical protein
MAIFTLFRIETACGMVWSGGGFSYDDADALEFDTEEDALFEIHTLDLQEVFVERVTRYSSTSLPKIYDATEARAA